MSSLSRRVVLQGASALGAVPFIKWSAAKAAAPATRYSAFSPEGKKALASYSKAVDAMVKRSEKDPTDPLGWIYQYKMHWYPDNGAQVLASGGFPALQQAQKAELDQFFGPPGAGNMKRAQAEATWGKCPHTLGRRGPLAVDFMPWHRKYLFFFERIVRKLSQDDGFTLPYWGYMDGKSSQVIPPEFTVPAPNPLFHDRAAAINHGTTPISTFSRYRLRE